MLPRVVTASGLADVYARVDWALSPVGAPETWEPALLAALDVVLSTRFAATLFWGPEGALLYNEAYVELIGDKHPSALGAPAREVFPEAWDTIGPLIGAVQSGGAATWVEDAEVPLWRRGFLEECYFTFSYSPVHDADGRVAGVLDIASEETERVLTSRRVGLLARLGYAVADVATVEELRTAALPVLADAPGDLLDVELRDGPGVDVPPTAAMRGGVWTVEGPDGVLGWLDVGSSRAAADRMVLTAGISPRIPYDDAYRTFLRFVAAVLTQALDRVRLRLGEQAVARAERGLSETLQRSLLTTPLHPGHVQIAVRYRPAAQRARVGGDWYDAFPLTDGALAVVIGDIAGHDRQAAAAMAQVRNLLRGVAVSTQASPAGVLGALDSAMRLLQVQAYATAVLARVETVSQGDSCILRWSNAGHPPPVLVAPDGSARLLATDPDLLLGVATDTDRRDHHIELPAGSTLLLYTDGLVERRGTALEDSLDELAGRLTGSQDLDPEQLCDLLLRTLDEDVDDDVALVAVRVRA